MERNRPGPRAGRVVVGIGLLMLGAAGCGRSMAPYASDEGDFAVVGPGAPKVTSTASLTPEGPQRMRAYEWVRGGIVYAVTAVEHLDGDGRLLDWEDPARKLDDFEAMLRRLDIAVRDRRDVTIGGNPGRDHVYEGTDPETGRKDLALQRVLVVGPRVYMITYQATPPSKFSEASARAFLDSFRLESGGPVVGMKPGAGPSGSPPVITQRPPGLPGPAVGLDDSGRSLAETMIPKGVGTGVSPAQVAQDARDAMGTLPAGPSLLDRRGGAGPGPPGVGQFPGPPAGFGGPAGGPPGPPGFGPGAAGFGPGAAGLPQPGPAGAIGPDFNPHPPGPDFGPGPGAVAGAPAARPGGAGAADVGFETEMVGGTGGFASRLVEPGRPLLGIDFGVGAWDGEQALARVAPVFARDRRPAPGTTREVAPEGYAVGGAEVRSVRYVNAIRFVYLKLRPDGTLDPEGRIEGEWVGSPEGSGRVVSLGGDGRTALGIAIKQGAILDGIALVMDRPEGP